MHEQLQQEVVSCWAQQSEICFPFTPAPARVCRKETNPWLRFRGVIVGVIEEYRKPFMSYVLSQTLFETQPWILGFVNLFFFKSTGIHGEKRQIWWEIPEVKLMLQIDMFLLYTSTCNKHIQYIKLGYIHTCNKYLY